MRIFRGIGLAAMMCAGCGGGGSSQSTSNAPSPNPPVVIPPPNEAPVLAQPNSDVTVTDKHFFSYDVSQDGTTFSDAEGDELNYAIQMTGPWDGLTVKNGVISGTVDVDENGWSEIFVLVRVADGHGGGAVDDFTIFIQPNSPPQVVNPNLVLFTTAGASVNYDLTQGGTTFVDPDGDTLTYEVAFIAPTSALEINGITVVGALNDIGAAAVTITAYDGLGESETDRLMIAVPAEGLGTPVLPVSPFIYADEDLPLPSDFRQARLGFSLFFDTTPDDNPTTNSGAKLGRVLFYDKRLSITNTLSCSSCHIQSHGFASPERFNTGVLGTALSRNAMGLTEVRYNGYDKYFSDHRAETLEGLALMPVEEPTELGTPVPVLIDELAATSFYPRLFEEAFGTPDITADRIAKALAQFLRSLISYNTRHDELFAETSAVDRAALPAVFTQEEILGFDVFHESQCHFCHAQDVQISGEPKNNGLDAEVTDPGADNEGRFRAASLRNIEVTAPYMHDGRFATLREVIEFYDSGIQDNPQLGDTLRDRGEIVRLHLTEEEKLALEAFLKTLTDRSFLNDPKFSDPFL